MTMGFHMMLRHEPALIGAVLGPCDHTFNIRQESGECVIAVPTIDLAQKWSMLAIAQVRNSINSRHSVSRRCL
jgi:flavin reductase (DIM6/NTAB) family NADH-FMN oxidoreductase RutF